MEGGEDQQQVRRQREEEKPAGFAQQARQLGRKRCAFTCYCQVYSGSMIVSRNTIVDPRISM